MVQGRARAWWRPALLVLPAWLALAPASAAQDTQYWTQHYGTRGNLLGGVVVGSVTDLSATFYNPGALSLLKDPSLLVSAQAYALTDMSQEDEAPPGFRLESTSVAPAPGLFAGSFGLGGLPGERLAYAILTRHDFDFRGTNQIADLEPDSSLTAAQSLIDQNLTETWVGLAWSSTVADDVGVGVTLFGAHRFQRLRREGQVAGADPGGTGATTSGVTETSYFHFRLLAKLGVSFEYEETSFGLALTTPSAGILGSGAFTGVYSRTGPSGTQVAASVQEDLKSRFRSPVSVALGAARRVSERTKLHATLEWFDHVGEIDVLPTGPIVLSDGGEPVPVDVTYAMRPVVNVGLGGEHRFSDTFTLLGSVVTDRTGWVDSPGSITLSTWDLIHLSAGTHFTLGNSEFTLGLAYAFGDAPPSIPEPNPFGEARDPGRVYYKRLLSVIALSLSL